MNTILGFVYNIQMSDYNTYDEAVQAYANVLRVEMPWEIGSQAFLVGLDCLRACYLGQTTYIMEQFLQLHLPFTRETADYYRLTTALQHYNSGEPLFLKRVALSQANDHIRKLNKDVKDSSSYYGHLLIDKFVKWNWSFESLMSNYRVDRVEDAYEQVKCDIPDLQLIHSHRLDNRVYDYFFSPNQNQVYISECQTIGSQYNVTFGTAQYCVGNN